MVRLIAAILLLASTALAEPPLVVQRVQRIEIRHVEQPTPVSRLIVYGQVLILHETYEPETCTYGLCDDGFYVYLSARSMGNVKCDYVLITDVFVESWIVSEERECLMWNNPLPWGGLNNPGD